jgi:hypothetical protein
MSLLEVLAIAQAAVFLNVPSLPAPCRGALHAESETSSRLQ